MEINQMNKYARALGIACALTATEAQAEPIQLKFINHLEVGLNELDVFVAEKADPTQAYRVTPESRQLHMESEVFAGAMPIAHNPFDVEAIGPFVKGRALGFTLAEWLAAEGSAEIHCQPRPVQG